MSSLSLLSSCISNGILTISVRMDMRLTPLPFISLEFYCTFISSMTSQSTLFLQCHVNSSLLSSKCILCIDIIILCIRISTLLLVRPYSSLFNRNGRRIKQPVLHHKVMFTWRLALYPFPFGFACVLSKVCQQELEIPGMIVP